MNENTGFHGILEKLSKQMISTIGPMNVQGGHGKLFSYRRPNKLEQETNRINIWRMFETSTKNKGRWWWVVVVVVVVIIMAVGGRCGEIYGSNLGWIDKERRETKLGGVHAVRRCQKLELVGGTNES